MSLLILLIHTGIYFRNGQNGWAFVLNPSGKVVTIASALSIGLGEIENVHCYFIQIRLKLSGYWRTIENAIAGFILVRAW